MHDHKHDHDHDHGHHHEAADEVSSGPADVASKSLSDPPRLSFRILTVIIIFVLIAFIGSGVSLVGSDEVAIKKVFGKVVGSTEKQGGLTYTWPYPVGEIQIVQLNERTLQVKDFWVHETPSDVAKGGLSERTTMAPGLRPGLDGALLTGDQNLLHADIECKYRIDNAMSYFQHVADSDHKLPYDKAKDPALDEMVRSAICNAAVSVAAVQTAGNIVEHKDKFDVDLHSAAQRQIDALLPVKDGESKTVKIISIATKVGWPIRAQEAYRAAQRASHEYAATVNDAVKEANSELKAAAGDQFVKLVGEPWAPGAKPRQKGDWDLIGEYTKVRDALAAARDALDAAHKRKDVAEEIRQGKLFLENNNKAEALLAKIDALLVSNDMGGQVSNIILLAGTARDTYRSAVASREQTFRRMLAKYNESPQFFLERTWADTRDAILQEKLIEKLYVTLGDGKTTVYIKRDAETVKKIAQELLKAEKDQDKDKDKEPARPQP